MKAEKIPQPGWEISAMSHYEMALIRAWKKGEPTPKPGIQIDAKAIVMENWVPVNQTTLKKWWGP